MRSKARRSIRLHLSEAVIVATAILACVLFVLPTTDALGRAGAGAWIVLMICAGFMLDRNRGKRRWAVMRLAHTLQR